MARAQASTSLDSQMTKSRSTDKHKQRCAAEEAHANHQLVPAILSPGVHDHLVTTKLL